MYPITPIVKKILILNIAIFFAQSLLSFDLIDLLGLRCILSSYFKPYQFFTHLFVHASFSHLFSNMFALWVFGRRVEDACGSWRFLLFYLLVGYGSDLIYVFVNAKSHIPVIGASGAVFGVMGAYLILYPRGRIRTLIFWFSFIPSWPKIRAFWVILYFLAIQLIPAMDILMNDTQGEYSVAYWGHLGGFFASLTILLFLRPEAFARYWSDTKV